MTKTEFILAGLLPVLTLSAKEAHKPNVLMICVDDMNGFGTKKEYPLCKTPYIDKLKSQGIIFSRITSYNVCYTKLLRS